MGLDIYHYKITEKYETPYDDYFFLEAFEQFPEIIERHKQLITTVCAPEKYFDILIFGNQEDLNVYTKHNPSDPYQIWLFNLPGSISEDIRKIEDKYSVSAADADISMISNTYTTQSGEQKKVSCTERRYPMTYTNRKVLYYKEAGHQRKGVEAGFYEDFQNDTLYFKKDDVQRVFTHLRRDDPEYYKVLAENFQANFIDNFVEGESIFYTSW